MQLLLDRTYSKFKLLHITSLKIKARNNEASETTSIKGKKFKETNNVKTQWATFHGNMAASH